MCWTRDSGRTRQGCSLASGRRVAHTCEDGTTPGEEWALMKSVWTQGPTSVRVLRTDRCMESGGVQSQQGRIDWMCVVP